MTGSKARLQRDEFWKDNAKCVDRWDLFFGPDDAAVSPEQEAEARALCRSCLVASDCAVYAELHRERYGVWAGENREPKRDGSKTVQARRVPLPRDEAEAVVRVALAGEAAGGRPDRRSA